MRFYNAGMSTPFQFSISRMLVAVSLFCVAASAVSLEINANIRDSIPAVIVATAGALFGAGIGTLFGKTIAGAAVGFVIAGFPIAVIREALWH